MKDFRYMRRTLLVAARGRGKVAPNPLVGALVVQQERVIAEGWHAAYGSPHAEVEALKKAGEAARGATLYVNLEPCASVWEGKHQPPCVDAIIAAGIRSVRIGHVDPHPSVRGRGVQRLRDAGLDVEVGVLEAEARELNEVYLCNVQTQRVFVHLKYAQSLDGIIATPTGDSKWISGKAARRHAHVLRASNGGILVGSGTLRRDNPELTVRHVRGVNPRRFVLDSSLRISEDSTFARIAADGKSTILTTSPHGSSKRAERFRERGMEVVELQSGEGGVALEACLEHLYREGLRSLLVEGGGAVMSAFLRSGLWHKITIYIAPLILGEGKTPSGGIIFDAVDQARRMPVKWRRFHDTMAAELYNT